MDRTPKTVTITLILILLNAAFWLGFAILVSLGLIPSIPSTGVIKWAMVILSLGCGVVLVGITFLLRRHNRFIYYFSVVLLALIAVLSITDEFGLPDLMTLLVSLVTFGLLVKDRAWYLKTGNGNVAPKQ